MKTIRSLSGVYFRSYRDNKWDNIVFEDLPEFEQNEILSFYTKPQLQKIVKILADTINDISETFDIISK